MKRLMILLAVGCGGKTVPNTPITPEAPVEPVSMKPETEVQELPETLHYRVRCGVLDLRINDIPVLHTVAGADATTTGSVPLALYQVDGENRIDVSAGAVDGTECTPEGYGRVAIFELGDFMEREAGRGLGEAQFDAPSEQSFTVQVASSHRWAWQDAPVLTLDDETRAEVDAFVAELHAAFVAKDADTLVGMRKVLMDETVQAVPSMSMMDPAGMLRMIFTEDANWVAAPYAPSPTDYRLAAGGRLVELVDAEGRALVRSENPDDPEEVLTMSGFVGRVDGAFEILR